MWFRLPEKRGMRWLMMLLCLVAGNVWAVASSKPVVDAAQLPYEIQADSAVFDQVQGTGEYRGHVQLSRGAEQLLATRMTLVLDKKKQLNRVEAIGSPVMFNDGQGMQGHAQRMIYDVATQTVRLLGDAKVTQGKREFSGAEITYHIDNKRVEAQGGGGTRMRIVLPPADTGKMEKGK